MTRDHLIRSPRNGQSFFCGAQPCDIAYRSGGQARGNTPKPRSRPSSDRSLHRSGNHRYFLTRRGTLRLRVALGRRLLGHRYCRSAGNGRSPGDRPPLGIERRNPSELSSTTPALRGTRAGGARHYGWQRRLRGGKPARRLAGARADARLDTQSLGGRDRGRCDRPPRLGHLSRDTERLGGRWSWS